MDELGLHSLLAIKTGHRGYPKKLLIEKVKRERFSKCFMETEVDLEVGPTKFFAGAFMDKKPLLVLSTCGTSLDAESATRVRTEYDAEHGFRRSTYDVAQPMMHDMYRRNFNGVDLFNRDCFGSWSL